ncbi:MULTISPECIES: DUF3800 domain-containing protein [Enterobacteriaceae]|uniref:DUF3800 domain-containing protein n=1 Tax=Enterobacteriaceae TaxID=543 RepID=UPI001090DEA9|nr:MULTISPECIES: DUF3800 domain-containing protein [Enterobacteriaceae]NIF47860.1 DUF3800 domain-containing protein [Enterobacter sp. Ap-1006]VFZ92058.1 Protein of uncharacterised function (DUF3800) [Klebsiella pneumoniae]
MHIAIDDTYGTAGNGNSVYVTKNRRTHVAVIVDDEFVNPLRKSIIDYLQELNVNLGIKAKEFHFTDIYNRQRDWKCLTTNDSITNMLIFQRFAVFAVKFNIKFVIQTVDDRTIKDHGGKLINLNLPGFDTNKFEDLSLLMLLLKLRMRCKNHPENVILFMDEGRERAKTPFAEEIFSGVVASYNGMYESSDSEPLLQLADFIAFCINRSTHLQVKEPRTTFDNDFLCFMQFIHFLDPDENEMRRAIMTKKAKTIHTDLIHWLDRVDKGMKKP